MLIGTFRHVKIDLRTMKPDLGNGCMSKRQPLILPQTKFEAVSLVLGARHVLRVLCLLLYAAFGSLWSNIWVLLKGIEGGPQGDILRCFEP